MRKLLELKNIEKNFGSFKLGPISLRFDKGITSLLGPSGSGKTTLLNIISGIIRQDSGNILLDGRDISHEPPEKRRIGYVFQDYALFPHLNVRENLFFAGKKNAERIVKLLEIDHILDRKIEELSGGEMQRVAIGRALMTNPKILLLDEPMSSVDESRRKRMLIELEQILRELAIPVIYVTHNRKEAITLSDRIAIISDGRILQSGTPDEIYERPASSKVAEFMGTENIFHGRIESSDSETKILWDEGYVFALPSKFQEGEMIDFCIRPEYVMIVRDGKPVGNNISGNIFDGKIVARVRIGGMHEIVVKLKKSYITAIVPDHIYHRLSLDKKKEIKIGFRKNKIHIMRCWCEK